MGEAEAETVMGAVARLMMVVALTVVPGGFIALFAYVAGRTLMRSWQKAAAGPNRGPHTLRAVFSEIRFEDIAREARAALAM